MPFPSFCNHGLHKRSILGGEQPTELYHGSLAMDIGIQNSGIIPVAVMSA